MCKPVLPLMQDKIAHIFWKAEHIAKVHHHHGHHHAEKEIVNVTQEKDSSKGAATSKISEPVSTHLIVHSFYNIPLLSIEKAKFGRRICNPSSVYLNKHYPPPRLVKGIS